MINLKTWLVIFAVLLGTGLQLGIPALVWGSLTFLAMLLLSYFWNFLSLRGLNIEFNLSREKIMAGEETDFIIVLENLKLLPLPGLHFSCSFSRGIRPSTSRLLQQMPGNRQLFQDRISLNWFERVRRKYTLSLDGRGRYTIDRAKLKSRDYFSLFSREKTLEQSLELLVYPRLYQVRGQLFKNIKTGGTRMSRGWIFQERTNRAGVRNYHYTDSWKTINWKVSARHQELKSDIYHPSLETEVELLLDVRTTEHHWQGFEPSKLEEAIALTGSLAAELLRLDLAVGLTSNGLGRSGQGFHLVPDKNPRQLEMILSELACLRPLFRRKLSRSLGKLSPAAQRIVITGYPRGLDLASPLYRRNTSLIILGKQQKLPDFPEEIAVYRCLLQQEEGGYYEIQPL